MKRHLFVTFCALWLTSIAFAQNQNLITTSGMGPFKIGSKISEIESITKSKIKLNNIGSKEVVQIDSARIVYKNVDYLLVFNVVSNGSDKRWWNLNGVISSDPSLKTSNGIGIGNTKAQILSAYDKFSISIYNELDEDSDTGKVQYIWVSDDEADSNIIFTTVNRIITKIEVRYPECFH